MMRDNGKTIFVPWDFQGVSEYALDHALFYSSRTKFSISLIYVVKNASQIDETKKKLEKIAADVFARKAVHIGVVVEYGTFQEGMRKATVKNETAMIIAAVDGENDIKQYVGKTILNMESKTIIPCIIVQRPKRLRSTFSVICPIDQRKESKFLLRWIASLSRSIELKVYLVYPEFAKPEHDTKIFRNLAFAKNFLTDERIQFVEENINAVDFNNSLVDFSRRRGVDLILNLNKSEFEFRNLFSNPKNYQLIANKEKIPVMCVTPTNDMWRYISFK